MTPQRSSKAFVAVCAVTLMASAQPLTMAETVHFIARISHSPFTTQGYVDGDTIEGWFSYNPASSPSSVSSRETRYASLPGIRLKIAEVTMEAASDSLLIQHENLSNPEQPRDLYWMTASGLAGPSVEGSQPTSALLLLEDGADPSFYANVPPPYPIAPPPLAVLTGTLLRVEFDRPGDNHLNSRVELLEVSASDDVTPPVIICPPGLTLHSLAEVPQPEFTGTVSDDSDPDPVVTYVGDVATGVNPIFITRTYGAGDAAGNSATCSQTLTILLQPGDFNGNGYIDRADLSILMDRIRARSSALDYDLNGDGNVDVADARFLALHLTNPSR